MVDTYCIETRLTGAGTPGGIIVGIPAAGKTGLSRGLTPSV